MWVSNKRLTRMEKRIADLEKILQGQPEIKDVKLNFSNSDTNDLVIVEDNIRNIRSDIIGNKLHIF